jgi:hypothetical protein
MRLSKDSVESEDEAAKDATPTTGECDHCGPSHSLETCPKETKESHREINKNTPVSLS